MTGDIFSSFTDLDLADLRDACVAQKEKKSCFNFPYRINLQTSSGLCVFKSSMNIKSSRLLI